MSVCIYRRNKCGIIFLITFEINTITFHNRPSIIGTLFNYINFFFPILAYIAAKDQTGVWIKRKMPQLAEAVSPYFRPGIFYIYKRIVPGNAIRSFIYINAQ